MECKNSGNPNPRSPAGIRYGPAAERDSSSVDSLSVAALKAGPGGPALQVKTPTPSSAG
jgi:hypothetical protein